MKEALEMTIKENKESEENKEKNEKREDPHEEPLGQAKIAEKAFHTKICVNCKSTYDDRKSMGICRNCWKPVPIYKLTK